MPESLQTRTEHSRSLEDAERLRAVHTLTKLGLLIPLGETESFHGRLRNTNEAEPWGVDPGFTNGGNDSGNSNLHLRPTLYSGEKDIAKEFAQARANDTILSEHHKNLRDKVQNYTPEERQEWLDRINTQRQEQWDFYTDDVRAAFVRAGKSKAEPFTPDHLERSDAISREASRLEGMLSIEEKDQNYKDIASSYRLSVHEITSNDSDAVILNKEFNVSSLTSEDKQKYQQALKTLILPITEGSPVAYEAKDSVVPVGAVIQETNKPYIPTEEIEAMAEKAGVSESVALQITSAYNARQALVAGPVYVADKLVSNSADIVSMEIDVDGEKKDIPLNLEYVQRFMREAHIVGMKHTVRSATLDKDITSVSFFDLQKTFATHQLEKQRTETWQQLGALASRFETISAEHEPATEPDVLNLLKDVYVKPEKLVQAAMKVEGYEAIFNADTGNEEGFSLAEHTETVLRNFDENFADHWPVELLAPMRLAMLVHDVGKPQAAREKQKHNQKQYNVVQAADFLKKIGVNNDLQEHIIAMIGDGEELAAEINITKGGDAAEAEMKAYVKKVLEQIYPTIEPTEDQIEAFEEMCKVLQICDGAAYTSMAVTRRAVQGRYRNYPSFNASFAQPVGLGKRDVKLHTGTGPKAPTDLTPRR